ncbi:MAG: peroxiredoxin [Candidatus Omnitrophica bacterium]|nr:peroxiredoxin [Candidatus Omnitrophota bacterium]
MLGVGDKFPPFRLKGVVSNNLKEAFRETANDSYPGKWLVLFFWPKDFTFVCPTEIVGFGKLHGEFAKRNAQLLGASTDSEFVHLAWRQQKEELATLPYPMLSDVKRELSAALGVIDRNEGVAQRACFIVDPQGVIRFAMATDLRIGRNPEEVLRVLDALQSGELCPASWRPGQQTIKVS